MTKKDFIALEQNATSRKSIVGYAIACYVFAGLTLLVGGLSGILDAVVLVAVGVILHVKKSFPAAIVLLAYGCLSVIVSIFVLGRVQGWLIPIVGVLAVIETNKLNKAWNSYKQAYGGGQMYAQPYPQQGMPAAQPQMTDFTVTQAAPVQPVEAVQVQPVEAVQVQAVQAPAPEPTFEESVNNDLINRYRDLLDMGIISQEEFDDKMKELLG